VIFVGELPDKTMFASLVMSTRGKPWSVWLGAAGAFVVHAVIAVTVGVALFHVLPLRVLAGVVAVMFLVAAALAVREATRGTIRRASGTTSARATMPRRPTSPSSSWPNGATSHKS
jgi:putative Ca2+/H+ antiporter (TMEM165/GDT1 family)